MIDLKVLNKKMILGYGIFFLVLYTMIDGLNLSYGEMAKDYGVWLVVINILINILMATMGGFMISLSDYVLNSKGIKTKGENMSFLSVVFGILTYGCTPCLISFFAVLGINFSVMALPFSGLPYKLISLVLMGLGIFIMYRELKRKSCFIRI